MPGLAVERCIDILEGRMRCEGVRYERELVLEVFMVMFMKIGREIQKRTKKKYRGVAVHD